MNKNFPEKTIAETEKSDDVQFSLINDVVDPNRIIMFRLFFVNINARLSWDNDNVNIISARSYQRALIHKHLLSFLLFKSLFRGLLYP